MSDVRMLKWPNKDPDDILDYAIDWTAHLEQGDAIQSATWSAAPAGLTLGTANLAGGKASVWLQGGTSGQEYVVTCRVVTTGGRQMDRSARVMVTPR